MCCASFNNLRGTRYYLNDFIRPLMSDFPLLCAVLISSFLFCVGPSLHFARAVASASGDRRALRGGRATRANANRPPAPRARRKGITRQRPKRPQRVSHVSASSTTPCIHSHCNTTAEINTLRKDSTRRVVSCLETEYWRRTEAFA